MTDAEFAAWLNTIPEPQKQAVKDSFTRGYGAGQSSGFLAGTEKADREMTMNKWLIPLAAFGVPVGMLIQRYLIVLG